MNKRIGFWLWVALPAMVLAAPYASEKASREVRFENPPGSARLMPIRHAAFANGASNASGGGAMDNYTTSTVGQGGNGGTVLNVGTKNYLRDKAAFATLKSSITEFRKLDLPVWIYDEDGYPSPAAGGLVVEGHPELASRQYIVAVTNSPDGQTSYTVSESTTLVGTHVTTKCVGHDREYAYPNLLMKEATARFIEVTHEAYKRELGDEFKYITSFFTDEPSIMAFWHKPQPYYILPISDELLAAYRAAEGCELADDVKYLIGGDPTGKTAAKRYRYWSMVGERVANNFTRQISEWCEKNGVHSGGHLFNEEGLACHPGLYGDFFKVLRGMTAPGCDLLTSNVPDVPWMTSLLPASAGELNGSRRIMTETSAYVQRIRKRPDGSDWNLNGRDIVGTLNKQLWAGVNTLTSYYDFKRQKIALEPDEEYRINLEVGRANTLLSESRSDAEIALLYPSSALMTGYEISKCKGGGRHAQDTAKAFKLAGEALYEAGRYFLIIDEPTIAAAKVENGALTDGIHRWRAVVLPGAETLPIEAAKKLAELQRQGGSVVVVGAKPVNSTTAFPDAEIRELALNWPTVLSADLPTIIAANVPTSIKVVKGDECLRFSRRRVGKEMMHFVFNDRKAPWSGKIRLRDGGSVTVWDPRNGDQRAASGDIALELPAYGAVVLTVSPDDYCGYVDVFTGTSATGHTTPAATTPFGMIQAGPDSDNGDWAYCSGYQYTDQTVMGYSQTHISGTGCADMGDVQILPFTGAVGIRPMRRAVDKRRERGEPGYYTTVQYLDGIKVEITASKRVGFYRITSLDGKPIKVAFNAYFGNLAGWGRSWYKDKDFNTDFSQNGRIRGRYTRSRWVQNRPVNYAIDFNRKWKSVERLPPPNKDEQQGSYIIEFDETKELLVKVAVSPNSSEKAAANIAAEVPGWNFDAVRRAAKAAWNRVFALSTAKGDPIAMVNWYTSLYHLYFQPHDCSDAGEAPLYTTLSLWDTFRAAQPWYTIVKPDIIVPEINMMLKLWKQHGCLPRMSYGGGYTDCMIGEHSLSMIAEAYLKGIRGFDTAEALTAMTNTVTVPHQGRSKENWDLYAKYGYIPYDIVKSEGASRVLETAYDDWCLAKFAAALGNEAVAKRFRQRSENWKNIFDTSVGFARGKDSKGNWREPFDPFAFGHETTVAADFTEGNSFQYSWHVLHDVPGLIAAMGGRDKVEANLDRLFSAPLKEGFKSLDITGLIGQYVHGNEPSHHIIYFYPQIGRPEKAAERIREVFDKFYFPGPNGLSGNDDCGQMSAWYVFSALGFYPFNPVSCEYVVGAPQLDQVVLRLPNGKVFRMTAKKLSKENKYVKSVRFNGKPLKGWKLRHEDIVNGGELVFEMKSK